jgi:NAD(P)-dependent dehydrogenase (short-subunit alcohol dehydrogenase family)
MPRVSTFRTDVAAPKDAEVMIKHTVDTFGRLDILHNNATAIETGRVMVGTWPYPTRSNSRQR